jgi:hypothetical protein
MEGQMLSKLLVSSVAVIGLLLMGPQKASADVVFACVNTTTGLIYIVSATTNCPPPTSGATWIKINWNATAGGQASNVRYTPNVSNNTGAEVICSYINVSAQPRTVTMERFNNQGQSQFSNTVTSVPPGQGNTFGTGTNTGGANSYCKFTVTDGTISDIRGQLQICRTATECDSIAAE